MTTPAQIHSISSDHFALGSIVITPNAQAQLAPGLILSCLIRHCARDWGEMDEHDRAANDQALLDGTRLFSSYRCTDTSGRVNKFWIITEADRSATTILMPEDY